tara:strand:+ start:4728 stop:5549 length:822 start_codon:yes stop_codon:yes gene_type:complete
LNIIESEKDIKNYLKNKGPVAFIPTMGNLHDGHLSLIEEANKYTDTKVVSIFVNPLQFNEKVDFNIYPRTIESDIEILKKINIDVLFIPNGDILKNITKIKPSKKAKKLCGLNRPGHFSGVLTIVNKLFSLIKPKYAFFGKKDYQQYRLIKDFVNENNKNISIIGVKIYRDINGLALSSRNNLLSNDDKIIASNLYKSLSFIKENKDLLSKDLLNREIDKLNKTGLIIDYLESCNKNTFMQSYDSVNEDLLIAVAAKINNIRLIDNVVINKLL